jgi:hypothetical protein
VQYTDPLAVVVPVGVVVVVVVGVLVVVALGVPVAVVVVVGVAVSAAASLAEKIRSYPSVRAPHAASTRNGPTARRNAVPARRMRLL